MQMIAQVVAVETGEVDGMAFGSLHLTEHFDKAPVKVGVHRDLLGKLKSLKFGERLALDVEMKTYNGKSKLSAHTIEVAKG